MDKHLNKAELNLLKEMKKKKFLSIYDMDEICAKYHIDALDILERLENLGLVEYDAEVYKWKPKK